MCRRTPLSWKESFEQGTVPVLRAQEGSGGGGYNALPEGALCRIRPGQPGSSANLTPTKRGSALRRRSRQDSSQRVIKFQVRISDLSPKHTRFGARSPNTLNLAQLQRSRPLEVPRSLSEYWCGSRYERHGVRCEASGRQALSFNFKCPQQSRSPSCCPACWSLQVGQQKTARNPQGTGVKWPNLFVESRRRWGPSPSVSLRELDAQDPCSRPHSNTRTGS